MCHYILKKISYTNLIWNANTSNVYLNTTHRYFVGFIYCRLPFWETSASFLLLQQKLSLCLNIFMVQISRNHESNTKLITGIARKIPAFPAVDTKTHSTSISSDVSILCLYPPCKLDNNQRLLNLLKCP